MMSTKKWNSCLINSRGLVYQINVWTERLNKREKENMGSVCSGL